MFNDDHFEIAQQWHPIKNGDLTPYNIGAGSGKKVWWQCNKSKDHKWQTSVEKRTKEQTGCPMCSGKFVVRSNCLFTTHPEISKEWHPTRNGTLTPYGIVAGSGKKVWWKCSNGDDHEWQTSVVHRTQGKTGCPVCINKLVVPSNCLVITHPEIAQQWHPNKNGNLTPYDVIAGSNKNVWWICDKDDDHEWQVSVEKRTSKNSGCPICANRTVVLSNCLATTHPNLIKQWHPDKNNNLTPYDVCAGSNKKVWWICDKSGDHEWKTSIVKKVLENTGCPACANRLVVLSNCLAITHPEFIEEWHPTKNNGLTPYDVTAGSHQKIWWICSQGHEWQTHITSRKRVMDVYFA